MIRPRSIDESSGHADAATALASAGGAPNSAPDTPLVVCVNDPDRDTDSASALRAIRADVGARPMHVVVATGSHQWRYDLCGRHERPLRAAAGEPAEFVWHDATAGPHVAVGPARLLDVVAGARDLVGVGSVEPHWFAGFTGAHKTLTVGVMHRDDIQANHFHAMSAEARPFRFAGNPVAVGFARVLDALAEGRRIVALNSVAGRWFGGAPLESLAAASDVARARWSRTVAKPLDFLVAVVEPPLSRTLYQAEKGIKNTEHAVASRGVLVLDAACEDGDGPRRFLDLLGHSYWKIVPAREVIARDGYRLGDHKAVRLLDLMERGVRVGIVSPYYASRCRQLHGLTVWRSREGPAHELRAEFAASGRGAIVEDAGNMIVDVA